MRFQLARLERSPAFGADGQRFGQGGRSRPGAAFLQIFAIRHDRIRNESTQPPMRSHIVSMQHSLPVVQMARHPALLFKENYRCGSSAGPGSRMIFGSSCFSLMMRG